MDEQEQIEDTQTPEERADARLAEAVRDHIDDSWFEDV